VTTPSCQLENYGVAFVKNGVKLKTAGAKITKINWQRVLDGVSTASVELVTAGDDCCGQLGAVDHWNTELIVFATNDTTGIDEVVWRGPCKKPAFGRGKVTVPAVDVLGWLQVRILEQAFNFVNQDVSDTFVELATYALTKDPTYTPQFSFVTYKAGVLESRDIDPASLRMTWNVVQEMLDAGLDVTTFGSQILVGIPAFTTINLRDTDVLGPTEVVKDGDEFANRVVGNASRDVTGIWPPGPPQGVNGYPLVEVVASDTQLQDQASAEAAAKARYDFSAMGVRRARASGGITLLPSSGVDVKALLAGQLFNFAATETCYAATETLRLGRLDVEVTAGRESTTIDLQPLGGVQGGRTL
jgi:hypothetical protein